MSAVAAQDRASRRAREIAKLAGNICLPFRSRAWRGSTGIWQGRAQGSSIDFQDHRAYVPGDNPRHLDWAAYARTNHYIMKVFREEVSPRLDLVLDVSDSMALTPEKEERALDLFALVMHTALRDGIHLRVYTAHSSGRWKILEPRAAQAIESLASFNPDVEPTAVGGQLPLAEIPWRHGSLRVLISDLLLLQPPERELARLSREQGRPVILAPYLKIEAEPDWNGNLELHDCESAEIRQQRVEPYLLERYRKNYQGHFELWRQEARRHNTPMARISCELPLADAIRQQALREGVFEIRH